MQEKEYIELLKNTLSTETAEELRKVTEDPLLEELEDIGPDVLDKVEELILSGNLDKVLVVRENLKFLMLVATVNIIQCRSIEEIRKISPNSVEWRTVHMMYLLMHREGSPTKSCLDKLEHLKEGGVLWDSFIMVGHAIANRREGKRRRF